jgi:histidyl-tRNA synthetase
VADKAGFYLLLDKKDKMKESDFYKELKSLTKEVDLLKRLFSLNTNELLYELDKLGYDVARLKELFSLLDKNYVKFDLSIVRGLAYYTDIVFEAFDRKGELRALIGGGEYNDLISAFGGKETPAVGFAKGDAVLLELLNKKGLLPKFENDTVFIATIGSVSKDSFKLREKLVKKGYKVDLNITERSLGNQLSYAQRKGYPKVYIIGEKELKKGVITVKDMVKGSEKKIFKTKI